MKKHKKHFYHEEKIFLLGLLFSIASSLSAVIIDPELNEGKKGHDGGGPRTIFPTVEVSAQEDLLIFELTNYVGIVNFEITTANMSDYVYINGNGTYSIDVTGIGLGYHEFVLTLDNGMNYHGSFIMQ